MQHRLTDGDGLFNLIGEAERVGKDRLYFLLHLSIAYRRSVLGEYARKEIGAKLDVIVTGNIGCAPVRQVDTSGRPSSAPCRQPRQRLEVQV